VAFTPLGTPKVRVQAEKNERNIQIQFWSKHAHFLELIEVVTNDLEKWRCIMVVPLQGFPRVTWTIELTWGRTWPRRCVVEVGTEPRVLMIAEVLEIHVQEIATTGGISSVCVLNVCEPSLGAQQASFSGQFQKDIFEMGATKPKRFNS
jgi:hypothetical protein